MSRVTGRYAITVAGTWNVEYAAGATKNLARLARLRSEDADVWVLTETPTTRSTSR